jgi:hypothetical protein
MRDSLQESIGAFRTESCQSMIEKKSIRVALSDLLNESACSSIEEVTRSRFKLTLWRLGGHPA